MTASAKDNGAASDRTQRVIEVNLFIIILLYSVLCPFTISAIDKGFNVLGLRCKKAVVNG